MKPFAKLLFSLLSVISSIVYGSEKLVLEPVGRYIYQAAYSTSSGTDHLLCATGISGNRMISSGLNALTMIDLSTMSIEGSQSYISRKTGGGGRNIVIYQDKYIYVNFHQQDGKPTSQGFGISKIEGDAITNLTGIKETNVFFEKMKISGSYLFVAAHIDGIRIYSLQNPEKPTLVGSLTKGFTDAFDVAVSGDTLFVADGGGGLKIVDISTINAPKIIAGETNQSAMGTAQAIEVRNGRTYLASGSAGICVYLNGNLESRKVYPLIGCTEDICWVGNYLAASTFGGVSVFEIGDGTYIENVATENTNRWDTNARIRTSFGIGAANDSTLLVSCWTTTDCYRIKSAKTSNVPDISCSTQRERFSINGGSSSQYIFNNGGSTLVISKVSLSSADFSTDLLPQSIEPKDTVFFNINYKSGNQNSAATILIYSNDPDENPLPIQVFGKTTTLDPGESVPNFTLPTLYTNPETGIYTEGTFTLSEQKGKVVSIQIFGTWCPACPSAEADMQNSIIKEFEGNPNVISYVLDQADKETKDWVTLWTTKFYQRVPMLFDVDGAIGGGTFAQPSVGNMPFGRSFIINQEGIVSTAYFGHQPQMVISKIYDLLNNDISSTNELNMSPNDIISISPNPVIDNCSISFGQEYEQAKVELYDLAGQKLFTQNFEHNQSANLNLKEITKGIYLIHICFDNKITVKKIIKY